MPPTLDIYLEIAPRRSFACAVAWPGWSRAGRTPEDATAALLRAAPRYAEVAERARVTFPAPRRIPDLREVERLAGSSGTEFGVPSAVPSADLEALPERELARQVALLEAAWATFDAAASAAEGLELRKGPRGGGRDLPRIHAHVLESEMAYVAQLGGRPRRTDTRDPAEELHAVRARALEVLRARAREEAIDGPSGTRKRWEPRVYLRRAAWHALDHAWELQDRSVAEGP